MSKASGVIPLEAEGLRTRGPLVQILAKGPVPRAAGTNSKAPVPGALLSEGRRRRVPQFKKSWGMPMYTDEGRSLQTTESNVNLLPRNSVFPAIWVSQSR